MAKRAGTPRPERPTVKGPAEEEPKGRWADRALPSRAMKAEQNVKNPFREAIAKGTAAEDWWGPFKGQGYVGAATYAKSRPTHDTRMDKEPRLSSKSKRKEPI